jgi:hypothetical protein
MQRAVELLLTHRQAEKDDRRYAEGYAKYPETDEEVEAITAAGLEALRAYPWED